MLTRLAPALQPLPLRHRGGRIRRYSRGGGSPVAGGEAPDAPFRNRRRNEFSIGRNNTSPLQPPAARGLCGHARNVLPRAGGGVGLALGHLYSIYFEKRSFSSSGSRWSLTQRRSAMTKGSRFRRPSKSATRRVRSSALAWQW